MFHGPRRRTRSQRHPSSRRLSQLRRWHRAQRTICSRAVKSTTFERHGSYTCNIISKTGVRYAQNKLDIFAVYLVPIDLWYIIPFEVAANNKSLNLTPYDGHKFAQYIEAWHLLRGDEGR